MQLEASLVDTIEVLAPFKAGTSLGRINHRGYVWAIG